jgi:hypothetical protein
VRKELKPKLASEPDHPRPRPQNGRTHGGKGSAGPAASRGHNISPFRWLVLLWEGCEVWEAVIMGFFLKGLEA